MPRSSLLALLLGLPLVAQQQPPSPIRSEGMRAAITRNAGLQTDSLAPGLIGGGAEYEVQLGKEVRFMPVLGPQCPTTQHVTLRPVEVRRGEAQVLAAASVLPTQEHHTAIYTHASGVVERYEVRPEGMELSWRFAARPAGQGDLVVRYAIDSTLGTPKQVGASLEFEGPYGGVRVGGVLGIAADGRRVEGGLHWRNDGLELSLPAAFVDSATYPLVLDPLVGAIIPVAFGITYSEFDADVAHTEYAYWLVVWRRILSATSHVVRGQRIDENGALLGSLVFFGSAGVASAPRLSSLRDPGDLFGVVWTQTSGGTHSVQLQMLLAFPSTQTPTNLTTVASTTSAPYPSAVVGGDLDGLGTGTTGAFVIVWEDDATATIRRRSATLAAGVVQMSSASVLWSDSTLAGFVEQPAISRHAIGEGRLLVVARRRAGIASASAIIGQFLDANGAALGTTGTIATSAVDDLFKPAVDGHGDRWIVAWEKNAPALGFDSVRVVTTDFAWNLGSVVTYGGSALNQASRPTVCYAPSRTWLGYRRVTALPSPTTTLQLTAVRSDTCTTCSDSFSVSFPSGPRIVAARKPIYVLDANPPPVLGLAVWDDSIDDIGGQLVTDAGTTGTVQALGSACGNPGNDVGATPPNIGQHYAEVRGFAGNIAFFNLSPVVPTIPCGTCEFVPLSVTFEVPTWFFWRRATFVIPCDATLVGAQFLSQWIVIDLAAASAPCPALPGFSTSQRNLLTIGQ